VRSSKYRHVFAQPAKKEHSIDNVKLSGGAWDTNLIAASGSYISLNWNTSGGGAFAILPLPNPFRPALGNFPSKLPDIIPLARGHSAAVLDTAWSPFDDSIVASGGEDGKIMIWKVEASAFDDWGQDHWVLQDFDPVSRIEGSARRVGNILFHPTADHVLAAASGDFVVKLWDLNKPESPRSTLGGHSDAIQSLAFNAFGNQLVTTCRDKKIRLFDPRAGGDPVRVAESHDAVKGVRVAWMGERDRFVTTGFNKNSDRQFWVWNAGDLKNEQMTTIDQSSGIIMPFWSDNGIIFLAGKGDGNIRYYEYESATNEKEPGKLYPIPEHKSSDPQRGMCFLPRRGLEVSECEIARAYKVTGTVIEPISFIVPRKSVSFQSDIYPPAPSNESCLTADEFFSGKKPTLKLVSLDKDAVSISTITSPITPVSVGSPVVSRSATLATPVSDAPAPAPAPEIHEPVSVRQGATFSPPPVISLPTPNTTMEVATLRGENDKLDAELREARAQIRSLELQLEAVRANARKAAQLLS